MMNKQYKLNCVGGSIEIFEVENVNFKSPWSKEASDDKLGENFI